MSGSTTPTVTPAAEEAEKPKETVPESEKSAVEKPGTKRAAEETEEPFKKKPTKPRPDRVFGPRPTLYDKDGNVIEVEPRKPKKKVAVMIGYCGTGYFGMQLNPPNPTIEGALFDALIAAGAVSKANLTDLKKNAFMRAARTDKGVHAAGNVISLKMIVEDPDIVEKINTNLPDQIRVWGVERVNKGFDCRKMCSSRVYEYLLPTYSLLPPKASSVLGQRVTQFSKEFPGITGEDKEGDAWWEQVNNKVRAAGLDPEAYERAQIALKEATDAGKVDAENLEYIKQVKAIENELRRSYRILEERLNKFQDAMNQYVGHHNFHNFTVGKDFRDPSANRFIITTKVSKPFVIKNTEWVSIKIHGQSFMLHQIRKMIGMASLVVRTRCPISRISEAFNKTRINVPKAPALGLLLECPVYDGINLKLQGFGYNGISFKPFEEKMLAFKQKYIYDKIYDEEVRENTFHGFYGFIDNFNGDPIFDFLTAKGITEGGPVKEVKIPGEKEVGILEDK